MITVASLFIPRRFYGPHNFKSVAEIATRYNQYGSQISVTTVRTSTYNMNSVVNHTLCTSAAEILKTPAFYTGTIICAFICTFFLLIPLFFVYCLLSPGKLNDPMSPGMELHGFLFATFVGFSCGLLFDLFVTHIGPYFAIQYMKQAMVKRQRGTLARWCLKDDDEWDKFVASLKKS